MIRFLPLLLIAAVAHADRVEPVIPPEDDRPWPGKDFWPNPAEDWKLVKGRVENQFSGGNRNLVVLTAELTDERAGFTLRTNIDQISFETRGDGFVGFNIGLQGTMNDYRDSAIHGVGISAGIDFQGRPFIGNPDEGAATVSMPLRNTLLEFKAEPTGEKHFRCTIRVIDGTGKELAITSKSVHETWLKGLCALTASSSLPSDYDLQAPRPTKPEGLSTERGGEGRFAFSEIDFAGDKVAAREERAFGPILWTTYTLDNAGVLRLLVQAAPFSRTARMEAVLKLEGRDPIIAQLEPTSRTALFRVRNVPTDKPTPFTAELAGGEWSGTIQALPKGKPVKVAALSCNDSTGFPHTDLVANVTAHNPDLIAFLGDQIYEKIGGYGSIYDQKSNDRAIRSYMRKYAMHGWTWRELLRDRPSITIPDDHDVFHGNLWGEGGGPSDVSRGYGKSSQDSGGYKMSVEFVNAVHRSQTGNLPEPADQAPCRSGMSVYFTDFHFGPLDIAILADRQFKSAPRKLFPLAQIQNGWPLNERWDPKTKSMSEQAELLGPRQENFLKNWADDPAKGSKFRVAFSQTPFSAPQTLPAEAQSDSVVPNLEIYKEGEYAPDDKPTADFDTNAWPVEKRNVALKYLKEAGALHITGDQHLGTTGQYGVEKWGDGPWWLSTPSIANTWPRRWMPSEEGQNRRSGDPKWLGDFEDGFGNKITMHAVANPVDVDRKPSRLFDRAVGYSMTTFDPATGHATIENWPYWASPEKPAPDNTPYSGWPIVIDPASGKRIK